MPGPPHDAAPDNRPLELLRLKRKATEELGLDPSEPLCQDIAYLQVCWNDRVYERVQRGLRNLELSREAEGNFGDRVPPPGALQGELDLGYAPAPGDRLIPVRMSPAQLVPHTVIAGQPGKGKTWLCRLLLARLVALCPWVCVLLFDPNRSYEAACSDPRYWVSLPWRDVRLNPIVPPALYPEDQWRAETIDQLARNELMHSKYVVANRLDAVIESARKATPPGAPMIWPSLYELRDALANMRCRPGSREWQYRDSSLNVLDGRIRSSGMTYNCSIGMEELLTSTRARISTEGLAPIETLDYFISNIIRYAYRRRCTKPLVEPPALHTIIVIEEAQTLLERRTSSSISFFQEMLLRARSLGLAFVFIAQDMSRIDPIILAACSNYFVFSQSSWDNKRIVQSTLDLSRRETALLGGLATGECFVRIGAQARALPHWPYPFLARIGP